jgi:predicted dehydrogenase
MRKWSGPPWPLASTCSASGRSAWTAPKPKTSPEAAEAAGVVHAVNLQGHHSPDARFVADLIAGGAIGRLGSAMLVAAGDPLGGPRIAPELAWSTDPAAGTSLLTIMAGHFLATLDRIAGRLVEVSARLPRPHDHVEVTGTGRTVPNAVPAQVLLHGVLESGATASVAVHGGSGNPDGFLIKLVGSEGTVTATHIRPGTYMHWTDWNIQVNGEQVKAPDTYRTTPFDPAAGPIANVAAVYQEIAQAIAEGRQPHPISIPPRPTTECSPPSNAPRRPASRRRSHETALQRMPDLRWWRGVAL